VKLFLTKPQKKLYKEYSDCFRYVHNKTLERVKVYKEFPNFQNLRNKLVTKKTKIGSDVYSEYEKKIKELKESGGSKEEIKYLQQLKRDALKSIQALENPNVSEWEEKFPKETRANAVNKVVESYKTAKANLLAGNIKFFDISYMKKSQKKQCVEFSSSQVHLKYGTLSITGFGEFKTSLKTKKKLRCMGIQNNCDMIHHKGNYYMMVLVPIEPPKLDIPENPRCCGVDPGLVKFATTFGNSEVVEYTHNRELLKRLNQKIKFFKERRTNVRVRKRSISKVEKKKIDYTNQLHWEFISSILEDNDIVYFGDIKSHGIVKNGKNKYLNQEFNDIKFYQLKQKLVYKATTLGKKVVLVNERYTSMCCAECGSPYKVDGRIYSCVKCKNDCVDRDVNAAKNIFMRGILN
jgi:IS605 OrfB family transposase